MQITAVATQYGKLSFEVFNFAFTVPGNYFGTAQTVYYLLALKPDSTGTAKHITPKRTTGLRNP